MSFKFNPFTGTLDRVESGGASGDYVKNADKVVRIDPNGDGDYTTIQAALTDNATTQTVFLVYPGTYTNDTINFTANNQTVKNMGKPNTTVVTNAAQIVDGGDFINCAVIDMNLQHNPTTDVNTIEVNNGTLQIRQSRIQLTTSTAISGPSQPAILATTGTGTIKSKLGEFYYYHTGDTGSGRKAMVKVVDGSTVQVLRPCRVLMDNSGTALVSTTFIDAGTGEVDIEQACEVYVKDTGATIVTGFGYLAGSGDNKVTHTNIVIEGGGSNDCYVCYLGGTGSFRSSHNNILVTGGANNYGAYVGASATLNSHMNDARDDDGDIILGTANIVSSEVDGELSVSGKLLLDSISEYTTDSGVTFEQFPITPSAAPDADYEVANKKYVDDNIVKTSEYASFYLSTGGVTSVAATATTLVINQTALNSNSSVFTLSSNQVTVNKTGDFEVSYQCYFNTGGSSRSEYTVWLEQDGVEVAGSRTGTYQRGYDSGDTAAGSIMISVTSGEVFRLRIQRTDGGATTGYQDDNGTRLSFKELTGSSFPFQLQ
jgi:hypothetical protein